jgi:hypothetical protein
MACKVGTLLFSATAFISEAESSPVISIKVDSLYYEMMYCDEYGSLEEHALKIISIMRNDIIECGRIRFGGTEFSIKQAEHLTQFAEFTLLLNPLKKAP